ncbi:hypothetical protein GF359_00865 [candidate division WOR-3 bacterium]|uniref:DUF177 domain-containing protein n=1 Tax=candidate division WOR-3 bacterium TaxID=2052148 RepID=A0A9D5K7Z6_UNCW3|nr:hypothetical protein [candidate division WOR-3 bacterium]MBD3363744.1 hypothetical protein [candidate division WOR-3 bacterium]
MSKYRNPLLFLPAHIDQGISSFDVEVNPDLVGLEAYKFHAPIQCKLDFERIGDRIDLSMSLVAGIEVACSKCGKPTRIDIQTTYKVTFLPAADDEDEEITATDLELYSDILNLTPILRDAFLLAIPIAPLCRQGCKGLCPVCGVNLNQGDCNCDKTKRVSPFEELKRLVNE